jgi:hypothetical protein
VCTQILNEFFKEDIDLSFPLVDDDEVPYTTLVHQKKLIHKLRGRKQPFKLKISKRVVQVESDDDDDDDDLQEDELTEYDDDDDDVQEDDLEVVDLGFEEYESI